MTPLEYKQFCESTYSCRPEIDREEYLRLLLIEELGEVASLFAKAMRDGVQVLGRGPGCPACAGFSVCSCCGVRETLYGAKWVDRDKLLKELGDVMWCAIMLEFEIRDSWTWVSPDSWWSDKYTTSEVLLDVTCDGLDAPLYWSSRLAIRLGFAPEEVAAANVEKLKGRVQRGTIHGQGDNR